MKNMQGANEMAMQTPVDFTDPQRMLGASPALLQGKILRGGMGTGGGLGGVFGTSLLGSLAGTFLGTAIASHFLHGFGGPSAEGLSADESEPADQEYSQADLDTGDDMGGGDLDDIDV